MTRQSAQISMETMARLICKANDAMAFRQELRHVLDSCGDAGHREAMARVAPGAGPMFGVRLPVLHELGDALGALGKKTPEATLPLLEFLWEDGYREERIIVGLVLEKLARRSPERTLDLVASFVGDLGDWEVCDQVVSRAAGTAALSCPDRALSLALEWATDPGKWVRRAAAVGLVRLSREADADAGAILSVLDRLMTDADPDVQKAVGWLLRDASKKHAVSVAAFLLRWSEGASRETRKMVREGMQKLSEDDRRRILASLERRSGLV